MNKPKYLFDKDEWMLAERIPDSDIFFFQIPMSAFVSDTSYPFLRNYKKVLTVYKKFEMHFYLAREDSYAVAESILKALMERPNFGRLLNQNIIRWSKKLIGASKVTARLPLQTYSNTQLWQLYKQHDEVHTKLYTYGWLPVAVDMFHNNFTNKLKSYLYSVCDSKQEAEEAFVILVTPAKKTILAREREEFLDIYAKYKKNLNSKSIPQELDKKLRVHAAAWGHLGYIYAGNVEPFGADYYLKEMRQLAVSKIDGQKLLRKEAEQLGAAKQKQAGLYRKLKISALYRRLFQIARDFALTKLVRRHAQLWDLYHMHTSLLMEIARRLKLTRFEVQFMLTDEVKTALLSGKVDRQELKIRLKHCILYTEQDFEKVYTGQVEKRLLATIKTKINKDISELAGQTAQPGMATGIVKLIYRAKDIAKMKKGDILVSVATDPDVVPAMKIAGAIVTEQGGITSHAAIVSRELGVPCIIGTKIATTVLKDGDLVQVDANSGVVKILQKARK